MGIPKVSFNGHAQPKQLQMSIFSFLCIYSIRDILFDFRTMYKRYGKWSETDLQEAILAVKTKGYSKSQAAKEFDVPRGTLQRHLAGRVRNVGKKCVGKAPTFSTEMELELTKRCLECEERFFGLSIKDVRKLAFEIADKMGIKHKFNMEKRLAGKKWFYAFMKRNPGLSVRQPDATSLARIKGFSKERVMGFFALLKRTVSDLKLDGTRIFNVDGTGVSTVQKKMGKVLGKKGKKQVGGATSGERGVNTTAVCCTSPSGFFIPPMIIFKRTKKPQELALGAPVGSLIEVTKSGYINSELFLAWLKHFPAYVNQGWNWFHASNFRKFRT